jgi:GDPmannose 4,6-dehydratase
MGKTAFITGITGQDGSYLAEHLLSMGYRVAGLLRRSSTPHTERIAHILKDIELVEGDMMDTASLCAILQRVQPDEIYNLAAQSFVPASWSMAEYTAGVTGLGALRLLDAMRLVCPQARFYQASSSEMFGKVRATPQDEMTPFYPRSPYGVAKTYAHYITVNYRESYNLFACCGICFNHESPRRGAEFVSRKITKGVAAIRKGKQFVLQLGNLDAKRDWGHAADYVRAMHMMLTSPEARDYVIGTGQAHTVRDFCEIAFGAAGLDWRDLVKVDEALYRPAEVDILQADPRQARDILGWKPERSFVDLVTEMVESDLCSI